MIKSQNQIKIETSSSSMSDLVFLLLIFFMITSTLISPNAVKLLLPESNSKTMARENVTVYIDENHNFYVENDIPIAVGELEAFLRTSIGNEVEDACVVLRADKTVPVQDVVQVIDAVNSINSSNGTKHKVILATSPKR
ncbi:MAG: biopolymer transporter ExbD [Bacteroidales bacterium]|nr:biopolymer transporter ExbD [Bacteroidales bacterium]